MKEFDEDWAFPYGTNHLTGVEIYSRGELWPDAKSTNVIAALPVPLALVPNDTGVFTERTPSNTYAFTWMRGHPNRLADATMDGRIVSHGDPMSAFGCGLQKFFCKPTLSGYCEACAEVV